MSVYVLQPIVPISTLLSIIFTSIIMLSVSFIIFIYVQPIVAIPILLSTVFMFIIMLFFSFIIITIIVVQFVLAIFIRSNWN